MDPTIVTPKDGIGRLPTVIDENPAGVEIRGQYRNLILAGVHVLGGLEEDKLQENFNYPDKYLRSLLSIHLA